MAYDVKAVTYIILSVLTLHPSIAQDIIKDPVSMTVFLGHSANFKCEVDNGFSGWLVNMTTIADLSSQVQKGIQLSTNQTVAGTVLEGLIISASAEYNNTLVQCVAFALEGSKALSTEAILTIQGQLSAVTNLSGSYNFSLDPFMLNWTAPFSLNVTGVDPDIWYSVTIGENIDRSITFNITETRYTSTNESDETIGCYSHYTISVTPFNGVGLGESSQIEVTGLMVGKRYIKTREGGLWNVSYAITGNLQTVKNIYLEYSDGIAVSGIHSDKEITFLLPANTKYDSPTFKVYFTCGLVDIPVDPFTTFDIQMAQAIPLGSGVVFLTGTFINETRATGCFVAIQSSPFSPDTFFAIKRDRNNQFVYDLVFLPPASYNVYVYDLEENGLPHQNPIGLPENIAVNGSYEKPTNEKKIQNATIEYRYYGVVVSCVAEEGDSCILIYKHSMSPKLEVSTILDEEYIDVDVPSNYTFALFRKGPNKVIDSSPFLQTYIVASAGQQKVGYQKDGSNTLVFVGLTLIHIICLFR